MKATQKVQKSTPSPIDVLQLAGNEAVRAALRGGVWLTGQAMRWELRRRVAGYRANQAQLRRRYGIAADTPVRTYDDHVRRDVEAFAATQPDARFAFTSGSTDQPKKIAFTGARLRRLKLENLSVVARTSITYPVGRPGLFILSGLEEDDSLSTLILSDRGKPPPYLSALLMPARHLARPEIRALTARYGATALRLWLLVLSNPGIVYATNPSTLALFLTNVYDDWAASTALIRDLVRSPGDFDRAVHRVVRAAAAPGWSERALRIANARAPLPMASLAPGWTLYCCWDGGYVRPFLDQVRAFLPPERFTLVPMYSMSTETIETVNYFADGEVRFLALAPGVLYEFLEADDTRDEPAGLRAPWELEPGREYTMVVSDRYGLRRYQTEDVFACAGRVGDVPDLRFLRRRGLTYSFTGEKLTDTQLAEAFARLRDEVPALAEAGVQLALIPSRPPGAAVPRYRLALAYPGQRAPELGDLDALGRRFDAILGALNRELAAKHASQRLAPTLARAIAYDELAAHLDPKTRTDADRAGRVWDTQFKLLPLYRKLWHEYGLAGD